MKWIDTSDLELWASKPASKSDLPLLISRLIRSTTTKITNLSIPKGKSTNRGGWDGLVMASEGDEFVPEGISLWEFGTTGNALKKAEEDYIKRTEDPLGQDIANATFIFVTPQPWEKANEWIDEKMKEKKWKDIKVYNGGKLEEWLSIAPIQSYWLAKEIGRAPSDGVESAEDYWENWKVGPEYVLHPELLTTGREKESIALTKALQEQAEIITVQASSIDEAIAFTIACVMQLETELQENLLARTVIVENEQSFKSLINNNDQLVIVAKLDSSSAIHRAVTKGHFVILPLAPDDDYSAKKNLFLPRLDREGFNNALLKSGLDKERAENLRKESGRSIATLRRLEKFDFEKPQWALAENARDILPALLIGKWDETKEEDKQVISLIANEPYESYITKLAKWKHTKDAPIYQIGQRWRISSPLDVWAHIAKHITAVDIENFRQVFLKVMQYVKPSLSLEPDQRFMASFFNKQNVYSGAIREGLVQSLILIAVYGDKFKMTTQYGGQALADSLVRSTFENADEDLWCSLNDVMPLIAEASPTSFLTAVETSFEGQKPIISAVFTEVKSLVAPSSYHTGLLWALENLAWLPDHLSRVTLILSHLDMLDPGGTLSNRPSNTLYQVFLPWHPQTFATLEQRIEILRTLCSRYPENAWKLFVKLLPQPMGGVAFQNHRCRWRLYNYQTPNITYQELDLAYTEVLTLCFSLAGNDASKIVQLLKGADASLADTSRILEHVKNIANQIIDTENKIWADLRTTLSQHRSMPIADWAFSEDQLAPFIELYDLFKPTSIVEQNKWLFQDHWPRFVEGGEFDLIDKPNFVKQKRTEAIRAIHAEVGLEGIISLLPQVIPNLIGEAFSELLDTEEALYEIFMLLWDGDKAKTEMLEALIFTIYFTKDFDWIKRLFSKLGSDSENAEKLAALLIPLPQFKEVLDFVAVADYDVQSIYWQSINPRFGDLDPSYKELGLEKLVAANRFSEALQQLSFFAKDISSEKIFSVLDAVRLSPEMVNVDSYSITRIFKELDVKGGLTDDAMVQLELFYLAHLTSYGSTRKPKVIHKDLAVNPNSFVGLLCWLYLADNDEQKELEKEEKQENHGLAMAGYKLLSTWKAIPGADDNGGIDYTVLNKWIEDVRDEATKLGRLEVADMEIAKILVRTKKKFNGEIWPPDEICEIIDRINTRSIRNNFSAEIFNSRGMTGRGIFEGGNQERELAQEYRTSAQKHAVKWPVTSSILDSLSKEYEIRGKEEDQQALDTDLNY